MSIIEFNDYQEYVSLIKNTNYLKLLVFSKEGCKGCKKSLDESEKILKLFDNENLIIKEVKIYNDNKKNITNSKIFENYKINYAPSYVLIYNNNFEKMINPEIKYIRQRIKSILDNFF
jgi:hypothetical protein